MEVHRHQLETRRRLGGHRHRGAGQLSTGKTVVQSAKAIRTLSGQAANTANRAAKLAARKAAHTDTIKKAVATQAAWQTGKQIVKCPLKDEEEECPPQ